MMNKGNVKRTGFALMVVMTLGLQGSMTFAGEESRSSQFLHRYEVLKANTTTILGSFRRARLDGHITNDRRPLLHLHKDVMDFCFEVRKYLYKQPSSGIARTVTLDEDANALDIAYSCEAMDRVIEAEFDAHKNGGQNPAHLLRIQEKYEEVWRVADSWLSAPPEIQIAERK